MEDYVGCVDGRWGRCYYLANDIYVGASVAHYGEYNPDETEFVLGLAKLRPGRVLDIGANIGSIAQALLASGYGPVETFEPQRELWELVQLNCPAARNHHAAVGDQSGSVRVPRLDYRQRNNFGGFGVVDAGVEVPCVTVDQFAFDDVGVMKIDVEGYEEKVLRGAVDTIARCKPLLYLENDRADKAASLQRFVEEELNYAWQWHIPPLFRENNHFGRKDNIWEAMHGPGLCSGNIVCWPRP